MARSVNGRRRRNEDFTTAQIILHWAIAALILLQYLVHNTVEQAFQDRIGPQEDVVPVYAWVHIASGTTILVLAIVRLLLRVRIGAPPAHSGNPLLIVLSGHAVHIGLYLMIFAMPITGLAAWTLRSPIAASLHEIGWIVILGLIVLHVIGALVEHVLFKNDTLSRMIPGFSAKDKRDD